MADRARRRRWLIAGLAVAAIAVAAGARALGSGPDLPPRTVADRSFARRADAVCARALPPLRRARPEPGAQKGDNRAVAAQVDRAADGLAGVVGQLRALPVAGPDEADVGRWLDDWDAYVGVGRRYADAVRRDRTETADSVAAPGQALSRRIFRFSKANGMPACVP